MEWFEEIISPLERVYEEILVNEEIEVDGEWKRIVDVNYQAGTGKLHFKFTDNSEASSHVDDKIKFKRSVKRPRIKPNKRII
jgi:hypothetical protein